MKISKVKVINGTKVIILSTMTAIYFMLAISVFSEAIAASITASIKINHCKKSSVKKVSKATSNLPVLVFCSDGKVEWVNK